MIMPATFAASREFAARKSVRNNAEIVLPMLWPLPQETGPANKAEKSSEVFFADGSLAGAAMQSHR
jgi:hypothetical protein